MIGNGLARAVAARWVSLANTVIAVFLALPFVAPILLRLGRADLANLIYSAYQVTCHEWPFRAYFLFGPQATYSLEELRAHGVENVFNFRGSAELGYEVAFCERNVAIYAALLIAGLLYGRFGRRLPSLPFWGYALLIAPMGLDGVTQLAGWRESTWELRTASGVLFGAASVWLIYPRFDQLIELLHRPQPRPRRLESPA